MKNFLARWFWQEGRWQFPVWSAWFFGIAAGAFWLYSGAPMICH
jgi:hypothetical protein